MGVSLNPFRPRGQTLPQFREADSSAKEPYLSDEYDYSDADSDISLTYGSSTTHSSRNVSDSAPGASLLPKRKMKLLQHPPRSTMLRVYPYRLPPKVTRWVLIGITGTLVLLVLSLVRASQVENWKVANGKANTPPPPPPRWEKFPFLQRYYGGIRTLRSFNESEPSYPLAQVAPVGGPSGAVAARGETENKNPLSLSWENYAAANKEEGIRECFLDEAGTARVPPLRYYNGRPYGFPEHVTGSYDILKLPEDICFERFGRWGPYGFGYSRAAGGLSTGGHGEKEGFESVWEQTPRVDYRRVDWADVQRRCFKANAGRYKALPARTPASHGFYIGEVPKSESLLARALGGGNKTDSPGSVGPVDHSGKQMSSASSRENIKGQAVTGTTSRTAVVVRCWDSYFFHEDDIANIRSMIAELSMASGGRYDVHLLVQVQDDSKHPIWADHEAYERRINETIPREFQGIVTLWTETQMLALYQGVHDLWSRGPGLPVHGVYRGLSMAVQHFAYLHPEYDFFWQWEMDIRYIGHHYDLMTKLEEWSKAQPRKGLWERSSRFYIPSVHGTWEDFSQMSRVQSEMGTADPESAFKKMSGSGVAGKTSESTVSKRQKMIWGPVRPSDEQDWFETDDDPVPPTTYETDKYKWGVGEEADLISLNPLFDPDGTTWGLRDDLTGYNGTAGPIPRRAAMVVTSRLSRRLLMKMHRLTAYKKQFGFPEMWPATVALQHGYKAVYAPHPVFVDRKWPVEYMAQVYNGGRDGTTGGSRRSVFGDNEHNLRGLSWFYNSAFAPNFYRRWLGLKVNNDGGEEFEKYVDETKNGVDVGGMPGGEGRMCMPPMLLHPVKDVDMPVEAPPEDLAAVMESDPTA